MHVVTAQILKMARGGGGGTIPSSEELKVQIVLIMSLHACVGVCVCNACAYMCARVMGVCV